MTDNRSPALTPGTALCCLALHKMEDEIKGHKESLPPTERPLKNAVRETLLDAIYADVDTIPDEKEAIKPISNYIGIVLELLEKIENRLINNLHSKHITDAEIDQYFSSNNTVFPPLTIGQELLLGEKCGDSLLSLRFYKNISGELRSMTDVSNINALSITLFNCYKNLSYVSGSIAQPTSWLRRLFDPEGTQTEIGKLRKSILHTFESEGILKYLQVINYSELTFTKQELQGRSVERPTKGSLN